MPAGLCTGGRRHRLRWSRAPPAPGLLFYLSGEQGTTADYSAGGTPAPNFDAEVTRIADGAKGAALSCGDLQRLAWRAPGNIYAQRGTLSFFWRSRYPVGPTEFPIFRVGFGDHSSWDMVWLRIDYNGHGFDAFVTDASLARTRVSVTVQPFPRPDEWTHLALSWDETRGIRFYVNGRLAAKNETTAVYNTALDQFGPHSRIISPHNVQSDYNFVRGGDIDEIRIYDRMLADDNVATLANGDAPTGSAAAARPRPRRRPLARRMVAALRLEPPGRSSALLRRRRAHRAQGRDPRRLRPETLVVEGVRRHPRDHLARRLQPLAPPRPQRLLPAARLGLLRRVRQSDHLRHARRAVESPRDFRRRLGQDGIAAAGIANETA